MNLKDKTFSGYINEIEERYAIIDKIIADGRYAEELTFPFVLTSEELDYIQRRINAI